MRRPAKLSESNLYILGIHDGINATACLLKDGQVVSLVSEERFTRIKNQRGFPALSIAWCLQQEGISGSDLERVVLASFHAPIVDIADTRGSAVHGWRESLITRLSILEQISPPSWGAALWRSYTGTVGRLNLHERIKFASKQVGVPAEKINIVDHHTAHACSAYFGSPFRDDMLVLTLDGEGDGLCSTVSIVEDGSLRRVASTPYYSSLGWIYLATTQLLGMKPNEHEYKVMGLAPYAYPTDTERAYEQMRNLIQIQNGVSFTSPINTRYAYEWLRTRIAGYRFDWIAGAVQKLTEEAMSSWVTSVSRKYGINKLAAAGGVFMNVKANMILSQLPCIEELFVLPSCGDEALAMGAAFSTYASMKKESGEPVDIQPLGPLYLGPKYDVDEATIRSAVRSHNVTVERHSDIEGVTADLLADGNVVARFSGRMEWGARALGNRSILARADRSDIVEVLNRGIKQRDFWMPFAPTILSERETDYIVNPKRIPAPYMIMAFASTELGQRALQAAMHPADKTLRPQILSRDWNPQYYEVIKQFEKRTDLGGLLNTSFNLHGEPIVCSPADAVDTFLRSGLRCLTIEDFLLKKT